MNPFAALRRRFLTPTITADFVKNADQQFTGRMRIDGREVACWLVMDEARPTPAFLKLTFSNPYAKPRKPTP